MKKILIKSLVTMYAILFLMHPADALDSNASKKTSHDTVNDKTTAVSPASVNSKAIHDFKERFNNPTEVRWFSNDDGFTSYFREEGFNDKVHYDRHGNWEYSLIFHNESKLPKDARAAVKSVYYDMAINLVEEVQTSHGKVYVIQLEDKASIKIVKVNDEGEMEIMEEITK